jgi:alpha-tubulin suppressor-like RCC1 family protein
MPMRNSNDEPPASDTADPALQPMLATGGHHVCTSSDFGVTLMCWGRNHYGQVGMGTNDPEDVLFPTSVNIGGIVQAISLGKYYSCASRTTGKLVCWGINAHGQLGDGTTVDHHHPTEVNTNGPVVIIAAGCYHTCAVVETGALQCWGRNQEGQMGNDGSGRGVDVGIDGTRSTLLPQDIKLPERVTAVALGAFHSCVLLDKTGVVSCWGDNQRMQLGNFSTVQYSDVPVTVGLGGAARLLKAGGKYTTCATLYEGDLKCWGHVSFNFDTPVNASVSPGLFAHDSNTPVRFPVDGDVVDFGVGGYHICVKTHYKFVCTGFNNVGQVGDGTMIDRPSPTQIELGGEVAQVSLGAAYSCSTRVDGVLLCWGENDGIMGDGSKPQAPEGGWWWEPERGNATGVLEPTEAGTSSPAWLNKHGNINDGGKDGNEPHRHPAFEPRRKGA